MSCDSMLTSLQCNTLGIGNEKMGDGLDDLLKHISFIPVMQHRHRRLLHRSVWSAGAGTNKLSNFIGRRQMSELLERPY